MTFLPPSAFRRRVGTVLPLALVFLAVCGGSAAPAGEPFLAGLARAEKKHDYQPLLAECDRDVAARPGDFESYRRRALARWGAKQYDGALADFQQAITLARKAKTSGRSLAILSYGRALIRREQRDTAAEAAELEHATRADRSFTDALNDLAWIRATNPDKALRNGRQAVTLAKRACEVVPASVKYLDTLAAAYAEAGDSARAAATEQAAIKAARINSRVEGQHKDFLKGAAGRSALYGRGERYREDPRNIPSATGPAAAATAG